MSEAYFYNIVEDAYHGTLGINSVKRFFYNLGLIGGMPFDKNVAKAGGMIFSFIIAVFYAPIRMVFSFSLANNQFRTGRSTFIGASAQVLMAIILSILGEGAVINGATAIGRFFDALVPFKKSR